MTKFSLKELVLNGVYYSLVIFGLQRHYKSEFLLIFGLIPYYLTFTPLLSLYFEFSKEDAPDGGELVYSILGFIILIVAQVLNLSNSLEYSFGFTTAVFYIFSFIIYYFEKRQVDSIFDKNLLNSLFCFLLTFILICFLEAFRADDLLFEFFQVICCICYFSGFLYGFIATVFVFTKKLHSINSLGLFLHFPIPLMCFFSIFQV